MNPQPVPEPISEPAAQFSGRAVKLFEFVGVLVRQTKFFDRLIQNLHHNLSVFPSELRRPFIPDDAFAAMQEFVGKAVGFEGILSRYVPLVLELTFCRTVDYYLVYVSDLLTLIFQTRPEMLKSNEQISLEEVLEYSDMKDLLHAITEKKVFQLSLKGVRALNEDLKRRFISLVRERR